MSATSREVYDRVDELLGNDDQRLPDEIRKETWQALDERDVEVLEEIADSNGGRRL